MLSELVFTPVSMEDKELFQNILSTCEIYKDLSASELTFESIFCWSAGEHALKCVIDEGIVIFYEYDDGSKVFYPPLVKKPEYFLPVVRKISQYCWMHGFDVYIERMTKNMADIAAALDCAKCRTVEVRSDFEYLYKPSDLIELEGKDYKNKRNFLHGFISDYDYEFLSYEKKMKTDILELVTKWGKDPASHDFMCEYEAIKRALDFQKELNLFCDVLKVDNEIMAFSIGFINQANVGVIMFEKADTEFRGSYQAINNFFASKHFANCKYINRQEDMGIEGLRVAKLSYHPVAFSEKYIITDKPESINVESHRHF